MEESQKTAESSLSRQQRPPLSLFLRCLQCVKMPRRRQLQYINHAFESLIQSVFWKTLIIFCTVLLLFGSPIQFLWVPKGGDFVFDILYTIALGIFILDMLLNLIVDPDYFGWRPRRMQQPYQRPNFCACGIGSFKFWCDVVSTAALCHDISYMNPPEYAMLEYTLFLDEYGIPVSFSTASYPLDLWHGWSFVVVVNLG